jgi:hypothetical protein
VLGGLIALDGPLSEELSGSRPQEEHGCHDCEAVCLHEGRLVVLAVRHGVPFGGRSESERGLPRSVRGMHMPDSAGLCRIAVTALVVVTLPPCPSRRRLL